MGRKGMMTFRSIYPSNTANISTKLLRVRAKIDLAIKRSFFCQVYMSNSSSLDCSSRGEVDVVWINCGPVQWHPCAWLRPTVDELHNILVAFGFKLLTWEIAPEIVAYRYPDDGGGAGSGDPGTRERRRIVTFNLLRC